MGLDAAWVLRWVPGPELACVRLVMRPGRELLDKRRFGIRASGDGHRVSQARAGVLCNIKHLVFSPSACLLISHQYGSSLLGTPLGSETNIPQRGFGIPPVFSQSLPSWQPPPTPGWGPVSIGSKEKELGIPMSTARALIANHGLQNLAAPVARDQINQQTVSPAHAVARLLYPF